MMLAERFLRAVTSFFVSNEQEVAVIACEDLKVAREAHTRRNMRLGVIHFYKLL